MTQVYDRKHPPHRWNITKERVAADCLWSHEDLAISWPGWQMAGRRFDGAFSFTSNQHQGDPLHPWRSQRCFGDPGGGLRGRTYQLLAADTFLGGPCIAVNEAEVPNFPRSAGTILLHWRKLDATNRTSVAFGHNANTPASYLFADLPNAAGTVRFYQGNGVTSTGLETAGLSFGDDVWAFTFGPRGMELWQNGIKRNSNATVATRSAAVDYWGLFGGIGGFAGADFAECGCCLVYGRQLEVPEILKLTVDPWTPFRPARRIMAGQASGGGATSRSHVPALIGL